MVVVAVVDRCGVVRPGFADLMSSGICVYLAARFEQTHREILSLALLNA